jgi:endoglucanase
VLVDDHGRTVKLVSVNWYGAESADLVPGGLDKQSATSIAHEIKRLGFNSVRLPFSNYVVECDPVVEPDLISKLDTGRYHALEVYDQVVAALANQGLMVILDDHSSDPTWSPDGNDTLWYNSRYPTEQWIRDWVAMAERYRGVPAVIGADLRNEPTGTARWGVSDSAVDWRQAAERAGNAVLSSSGNPKLLVMVEGIDLGVNLAGVKNAPICLQPGQRVPYAGGPCPPGTASGSLVYAPHDYTESQSKDINKSPTELAEHLEKDEGWAAAAAAAPLWIGEFGTCNTSPECVRADPNSTPTAPCANTTSHGPVGTWFANFTRYVAGQDFSWGYWPLNGTESTGTPDSSRNRAQTECYGLLNREWNAPPSTAADLICVLQSMIRPSPATNPADGCHQTTGPIPVPFTGGGATEVKTFEPWVPVGQVGGFAPASGLVVTHGGTATCDSGSNDDPGRLSAVRCFLSGNVITPCFVYTRGGDLSNPLLCSNDPTSNQVTEVTPTGEGVPVALLNHEDPSQPPWFLVLADGRKCSLQGYGTNTDVLSYDCSGGVEATMPDRSKRTWTVREGTNQANPKVSTTTVPVVTAYR